MEQATTNIQLVLDKVLQIPYEQWYVKKYDLMYWCIFTTVNDQYICIVDYSWMFKEFVVYFDEVSEIKEQRLIYVPFASIEIISNLFTGVVNHQHESQLKPILDNIQGNTQQ